MAQRRSDRIRIVDDQTVHFVLTPREGDLAGVINLMLGLLAGQPVGIIPKPPPEPPPEKPRPRPGRPAWPGAGREGR